MTRVLIGAALAALLGCNPYCEPSEGTICTIVGTGTAGVSGDGGDARAADIYQPMDVTLAPDGRLFVVDWNNHRIRAVDERRTIETVIGTGVLGDGPPGPALQARFNHPTNVEIDPTGQYLYIAAWHNSRIRRVDLATNILEDLCGTGLRSYEGDGGPAAAAVLDLPAGVAFDGEGRLVVVDQANQVIRRIERDGTIQRVAGQCLVVGHGCAAGDTPVQCEGNDKHSCDPAACFRECDGVRCANPCEPGFAGDGGPALAARFAMPFGQSADPAGRIAIDLDGSIFLADTHNHRIRRIGADGIVTTIAGTGDPGYAGDGGPATEAQLDNPVDLELAEDGTLYVADTFNSCIRAVSPDGIIRTVAGRCGVRGFAGDGGPPQDALLDWPYGIEVANGRLYVSDTNNNRVRVIVL